MDVKDILKQLRVRATGHALMVDRIKSIDRGLRITAVVISSIVAALSVSSVLNTYAVLQYIQVVLSPIVAILTAVNMIMASGDSIEAHSKAAQRYDATYAELLGECCLKHSDEKYQELICKTQKTITDTMHAAPVLSPRYERQAMDFVTSEIRVTAEPVSPVKIVESKA